MSYCVIDLETTAHTTYKRVANCFDINNRIVAIGAKFDNEDQVYVAYENETSFTDFMDGLNLDPKLDTLVGQNIKFDLLFLWEFTAIQSFIKAGGKIFDTQIAEYIITGQQQKMASLDYLSSKYGGTSKNEQVKAAFSEGLGSESIPRDLLLEYLEQDVLNTELVFLKQNIQLKIQGQSQLFYTHTADLLALCEMEYNGCQIDIKLGDDNSKDIKRLVDEHINNNLEPFIRDLPLSLQTIFSWSSNDHIGTLLYGGEFKYKEVDQILQYKSGARVGQTYAKYKNMIHKLSPNTNSAPILSANGKYKVDEEILAQIKDTPLAGYLLTLRDYNKQKGTYYDPIIALAHPDGRLHPQFMQTVTDTGRLSGRNPNPQNIPRGLDSDIKKLFISRFKEGVLIEIDAAQLEVRGAAEIFMDTRLVSDMNNNVDIHKESAAWTFNKSVEEVTSEERTAAKECTFGILYGQQAKSLAQRSGFTVNTCEAYIDAFFVRYPSIKKNHNDMIKDVKSTRIPLFIGAEDCKWGGIGNMKMWYGRYYTFVERNWYKDYGNEQITFRFPQIKNFPIQGFGADILSAVRAEFLLRLKNSNNDLLMVNTVHDSIIFDSSIDHYESNIEFIKKVLADINSIVYNRLGIALKVPFPFDIKVGKNWKEMHNVE